MRRLLLAIAAAAAACGPDPGTGPGVDAGAIDGATPPYPPWALAVLPDTQVYLDRFPAIWDAQTQWLADHAVEQGLRMVLHVGDVTEWNTPGEWQHAATGFAAIEAVVPLVVVPGNHDYDVTRERASGLGTAWPVEALRARPSFGGLFEADRPDNHYQQFDIDGQRWLVLALEWAPRPVVLDWAEAVLDQVPADHVIVVTHAYLYNDDRRYDWADFGPAQQWSPHSYVGTPWPLVTDGEELWQTVLAGHDNVDLVVSGHVAVDGVGRATDATRGGHPVHQVLQDYQGDDMGGAGYLRIVRFFGDRIEVETYSPWLDQPSPRPDDRFALPWHP